jgi:molybdate transport system substrate-binding protein
MNAEVLGSRFSVGSRFGVRPIRAALVVAATMALTSRVAAQGDIKVLCSNGLKAVMEELAPRFEAATRRKVVVRYGLAARLEEQIEAGEIFNVAILTPAAIDDLIAKRKAAPESRTIIARSPLGIAVRMGAPKPDITTVDAFTRSLLAATSIAYAKEGASGVAFAALVARLGIADDLKARTMLTSTGAEVGEAVAGGKAQFGVLPLSEILPVRGAELLGTFPAELQSYVVMEAAVAAGATESQSRAARDLIAFLMAPAARPVMKARGMEAAK